MRSLVRRLRRVRGDRGVNTVEYAMLMLAGVAFAGIMIKIVNSEATYKAFEALIKRALG